MALKWLLLSIVIAVCSANTTETRLKCWRCSSDAQNGAFCDDPFDPSVLTEQQKRWAYVECSFPPNLYGPRYGQYSNPIMPVCKKAVHHINGAKVISRSCSFVDKDDPPNKCVNQTTPSYIQTESCETCTTDGCNGF